MRKEGVKDARSGCEPRQRVSECSECVLLHTQLL